MTKFAFGLAAVAIVAAPQTIEPIRPGEMTKARVWVENRGRAEAIPVDLRESSVEAPLRVRLVNNGWEYESVSVTAQDVAAVLNRHGMAGWETTGVAFASGNATMVL